MICTYCEGDSFEVRKRTLRNDTVQFAHQCLRCGRAGGTAVSRAALGSRAKIVADFDETLTERWDRADEQARAHKKLASRDAWFRDHNEYLRTEAWRLRRDAVMARARGICEGCCGERATQVHHLTYEHWKAEFLWELVAICDYCHERIHRDTPGHKQ